MELKLISDRLQSVGRLIAPTRKMPSYLLMFVTNRCDAKCAHCFYYTELNKTPRDELTVQEFDALARSIGPMLQITLTGGSPELRVDLPEVAQRFVKHCRPANMTWCMNGAHTDRIVAHAEKVLSTCPNQRLTIGLSLDGLGEEHDRLRGMPGLFVRVCETFRRLNDLKSRFGSRFRLGAGIVVSGLNYESAERTAAWARTNLPIDVLKPILVRGDVRFNPTPDARALDRRCGEVYLNVIDQDDRQLRGAHGSKDTALAFAVSVKEMVQRELIRGIQATGRATFTCAGGRETAVVQPNGDVNGCEPRPEVLGNLRRVGMDFAKIWFSAEADHFRNNEDPDRCPGCHHHCFISPPIFRSPRLWPKVVRAAWRILRGPKLRPDAVP